MKTITTILAAAVMLTACDVHLNPFTTMPEIMGVGSSFRADFDDTLVSRDLRYITVMCVTPDTMRITPPSPYLSVDYKFGAFNPINMHIPINACKAGPLVAVYRDSCGRYCTSVHYSVYGDRPYPYTDIKPVLDAVLDHENRTHF